MGEIRNLNTLVLSEKGMKMDIIGLDFGFGRNKSSFLIQSKQGCRDSDFEITV